MVYLGHWGMTLRPFDNNHTKRFFVPHSGAALALAKLRYAVASEFGAMAVYGPAGVGKSELATMILSEAAEKGLVTGCLTNPAGTVSEVLISVGAILGAPPVADGRGAFDSLHLWLSKLGAEGRSACLMVDDIQTIQDLMVLETLRMLLSIEEQGRRVLSLLLIGQESMLTLLNQASEFSSHLSLKIQLSSMSLEETKMYILFRLKAAGCTRGVFTRKAAERVFALSRGIPRNVNRLCELALLTGYGLGVNKVDPDIVTMSARDLGLLRVNGLEHVIGPGGGAGIKSGGEEGVEEDILAGLT